MGKGQDNASIMGKATTGFAGLTICIALVGLIIGLAMIQFHVRPSSLLSPPAQCAPSCCAALV